MQPIDIGSSKQLFVDDRFIATGNGVELAMNPPYQATEPVVTVGAPWEEPVRHELLAFTAACCGKMMVASGCGITCAGQRKNPSSASTRLYVGYAESTDGIHFDKPELNLIDESGSTANNVVIPSKLGGSSVWIDPHAPPEERYKNQSKVL